MGLAAILALFSGCSREDKPPAEIAEPESSGLKEEFLQHAQALEDSKNRYFGRQQITALQLTLREADPPLRKAVDMPMIRKSMRSKLLC